MKRVFAAGLIAISLALLAQTPAKTPRSSHLDWAKILVKELHPENTSYTWSTFANSEYYEQTVRQLVIGRLDLPMKGKNQ